MQPPTEANGRSTQDAPAAGLNAPAPAAGAPAATMDASARVQAFGLTMRQHNRRLFRTARAIVGDDSEAEDVLQNAYLRAFAALDQFAGHSSLATWLTRITVNEALGRLRHRRHAITRFEDVDESEFMSCVDSVGLSGLRAAADPEDEAARAQIRAVVERAIDTLPIAFRVVFVLRAVEELTVEETAQCLGIPQDTVKSRFHRARQRLRDQLAQQIDLTLPEAFAFDGARCDRIVEHVLQALGVGRQKA